MEIPQRFHRFELLNACIRDWIFIDFKSNYLRKFGKLLCFRIADFASIHD